MKIPAVGTDIEQAIEHLMKLTFLHNFLPIVLAIGIVVSAAAALYKPTRPRVLCLIGFTLILFHFEYIKHILPALQTQTQVTLTTQTPNYRFIWITEKLLTRIVPFLIGALGWGSIAAASLITYRARRK